MATLYKRGRAWYIHYVQDGRQIRRSLGPIEKAQAERERSVIEYKLRTGALSQPAAPLFSDFTSDYEDWYEAEFPDTYDKLRYIFRVLGDRLGQLALDQITEQVVDEYRAKRSGVVQVETLRKEIRTLKAMLNRAVKWNIIQAHPCKDAAEPRSKTSKPPPFYTKKQLRELYRASLHHRWQWQFMVNTGVRRTEALQIKRADIHGTRLRVLSEEWARTKSGKWREIPLNKPAEQARKRLKGGDYLFPTMRAESMSRAFRQDAKRAKLPGNLHWLRHTFASHLVMAGVPLRTVQVLMGHSTIAVTEKYAHLAPSHLRGATAAIAL